MPNAHPTHQPEVCKSLTTHTTLTLAAGHKKSPLARGGWVGRGYSSSSFPVFSIADKFRKSSTVIPSFFEASSNLKDCSLVKEQVYMWSLFSGSSKSLAILSHLAGGIGFVESHPFKAFSETESLSANSFRLISWISSQYLMRARFSLSLSIGFMAE